MYIFLEKSGVGDGSHIFVSLEYFLQNISMVTIEDVVKLFPTKSEDEYFTPKDRDDFNRYRLFS
jgi:hypothetical protein